MFVDLWLAPNCKKKGAKNFCLASLAISQPPDQNFETAPD